MLEIKEEMSKILGNTKFAISNTTYYRRNI